MTLHVLGSLNMDLVCHTPRLPTPGETVLGSHFTQVPGGKGANQAVAAARLGAPTRMVGRVGQDSFGDSLLQSLQAAGVATAGVQRDSSAATGIAAIALTAQQNQIVVVPGANSQVDATDVQRLAAPLSPQDTLLLQLEIPLAAVTAAAQVAHSHQVRVILDPAPAPESLSPDLFAAVDVLTPNRSEAGQLVGFPVHNLDTAAQAAQQLRSQGVPLVIVKLGEQGVWVDAGSLRFHQPAFAVPVVDTVAAGDAFNGALAVALSTAMPLPAAVRFAGATAALSVSRSGAQPSMPSRTEVETLLH